MSDTKGKRPGRVSERNEGQVDAAPSIVPEPTPMPEPRAEPAVVVAPSAGDRRPEARHAAESAAPSRAAADNGWAMMTEVQAALARGFTEFALGMTGMTRSTVAVAADAAVAMLGARTFAEAVEINATLARRGADAVIEGSAKLSEIGVAAMAEATRPLLSHLGTGWIGDPA